MKIYIFTVSVLLFIIALACTALAQSKIAIFTSGSPRVYLDAAGTEQINQAVSDLQRCFQEITGKPLPTQKGSGLIPLVFELRTAPKNTSYLDSYVQQGYSISAEKTKISLIAYTNLGMQNAVYGLLDSWGCKWVLPGTLGEVIPKRSALYIASGITKSPKGYDNGPDGAGPWSGEPDITLWNQRNQGARNHSQSSNHYWNAAIPPATYFEEHPEWYALIGDKRVPSQLCTTNPEVINKMVEVAKEYLRRSPDILSFPMDPEDNMEFCQCENCRKLDPPGRGVDGMYLLTDRVIAFCNAVAEGIHEEFPDRYIGILAYSNHLMPPVKVKPHPALIITICRSNTCNLHLLPLDSCPSSKTFYEIVEGWSKLTSNINIYEYDPISWIGSLPCPTYIDHGKALSLLHDKFKVKGGVVDRVPYTMERSPTIFINYYMERRIKTDPSRKPEKELADMCKAFFGPGGKWMNMYYMEMAKAARAQHPGRSMVGMGLYRYHEFFSSQMIKNARTYIDKALASAGGGVYLERVKFVDLGQQYLEAYLQGVWSAQKKDYSQTVASFDRADRMIDAMDAIKSIDAADAHYRMHCARMKTLAEHFADTEQYVRTWKLAGPYNNDAMDFDFKPVKPDPDKLQWTSYSSPEGMLNFEEAFKQKKNNWRLSSAYAMVEVVVPADITLTFKTDSFFAYRVYVNGVESYHRAGLNADCPDRIVFKERLLKGKNRVIFASSQTCISTDSFPWGLYLKITDESGSQLKYSIGADGTIDIQGT